MRLDDQAYNAPLPDGFRSTLVTAVSILLGFGLSFWREWIDSDEPWVFRDVLVVVPLALGVLLGIVCLYKLSNPINLNTGRFLESRLWFFIGVALIFVSFILASSIPEPPKQSHIANSAITSNRFGICPKSGVVGGEKDLKHVRETK